MSQETINTTKDTPDESVMNFSKSKLYLTYGIIAINAIIFILMVAGGVDFFAPRPVDVMKWGANYPPLTFGGDWWRLFTSVFVHFGILHLAMNMYALYFIGSFLEPMLGKVRFIVAYVCAGIAASLVSVLWHSDGEVVSAGASGAIFGMFGVFLSLLTTNIIPKHIKGSLMQSVLFFVLFNVFYGFKPGSGIDNAAHLGGLFSGMVIGYIYYFSFRPHQSPQKNSLVAAVTILLTAGATFMIVQNKKSAPITIDYETGGIYKQNEKEASDKFTTDIELFYKLQDESIEITASNSLGKEEYLNKLKTIVLPNWERSVSLMQQPDSLSLPEKAQAFRKDHLAYAAGRVQETRLFIRAEEEGTDKYTKSIDSIQKEIRKITEKINNDYKE